MFSLTLQSFIPLVIVRQAAVPDSTALFCSESSSEWVVDHQIPACHLQGCLKVVYTSMSYI